MKVNVAKATDKTTEGIVIKTLPVGERDIISTLLTPNEGILQVVSKRGSKRLYSSLVFLDIFFHVNIMFRKKQSNLARLMQVTSFNTLSDIAKDLRIYSHAVRMAEVAYALSYEGVANTKTYSVFFESVKHIQKTQNLTATSIWFDFHMLSVAGYKPEITACVECRSVIPQMRHVFHSPLGGILCRKCSYQLKAFAPMLSVNTIKLLRFITNTDLETLENLSASKSEFASAKRVLSDMLYYVCGRKIVTDAFVEDIKKL